MTHTTDSTVHTATEVSSAPLFSAQELSVHYGAKPALREVTLDIHPRRLTAIIGPSGCGKSTFLSTLNRITDLIPGCRVSGALRLEKTDILSPECDVVTLRRRVAMIFQRPNPFPLSIRENMELPLREHGISCRHERAHIVEGRLRDTGLWPEVKDRLKHAAQALSGGQQQRLCIARALALNPEVVLFDEPCSALDPIASARVEDLIASLRGRVTVVIVTHNLAQARRIADDVAMFWVRDGAGTVVESNSAESLFHDPQRRETAAYVAGARG